MQEFIVYDFDVPVSMVLHVILEQLLNCIGMICCHVCLPNTIVKS